MGALALGFSACSSPASSGVTAHVGSGDASTDPDSAVVVVEADGGVTVDASVPDDSPILPDGPAIDAGPAADLWASAALPAFDAATLAHVRQVHAKGVAMGNRDTVFAKVGDSITSSQSYAVDCGNAYYSLDKYAALKPTIDAISAVTFIDNSNSFTHESLCGQSGMTTRDAVKPPSPVTQELTNIRPSFAILMYGTDDMDIMTADQFRVLMLQVVDLIEAQGTVVAVSTIPENFFIQTGAVLVPQFNDAITSLVAERHLPFIDYHLAMQPLGHNGISGDDVHPSVELNSDGGFNSCDFTPTGLAYGYNVRNLLSVQMLDRFSKL